MIKYYNTFAEYTAATKSAFESQVSLIGADNNIRYDGKNVVVGARSAKTGSIVALDGLGAAHFVAPETYNSASFMSNWQTIGVVGVGVDHPLFRGQLIIVHKTSATRLYSTGYAYRLGGYTLDGTDRTGTLNLRDASNWNTAKAYVISYNATSAEALVNQLNAFFKETAALADQDWVAQVDSNGDISLTLRFVDSSQASNTGSAGFSLTKNFLPEWIENAYMLRYTGARYGTGAVINLDKAIAYFKSDNSSPSYNPSIDVTSVKTQYPVCLPAYLGTSVYQSDHCALLRSVYGEGKAGWRRYMEDCRIVLPSSYGVFNHDKYGNGLRNTYVMAGRTLALQDGSTLPLCPAADYCASIGYSHELFRRGRWAMPAIYDLACLMSGIKYGTESSRKADPLNAGLYAIGGTAVSNTSNVWSASRNSASGAWLSNGKNGLTNTNGFYGNYFVVPCVLLDIDLLDA